MNRPTSAELRDTLIIKDRLEEIQVKANAARDLELMINDMEERLKAIKKRRDQILEEELPDMLLAVGMKELILQPKDNQPAMRLKLVTTYAAGISSKWTDEKRKEAFDWLEAHGHGDLIKTAVTVKFAREERAFATALLKKLQNGYGEVDLYEAVHTGTLTAWFKEMVKSNAELPPLDVIGGYIGQEVKIIEIGED